MKNNLTKNKNQSKGKPQAAKSQKALAITKLAHEVKTEVPSIGDATFKGTDIEGASVEDVIRILELLAVPKLLGLLLFTCLSQD